MSSVSSLETTAASDESSSADSACSSDVIFNSSDINFLRHRRDRLKPTAKLMIKRPSRHRRVVCRCRACGGVRMVSQSTRYRHLRVEAEMAEDDARWEARWSFSFASLWLFRPEYQC